MCRPAAVRFRQPDMSLHIPDKAVNHATVNDTRQKEDERHYVHRGNQQQHPLGCQSLLTIHVCMWSNGLWPFDFLDEFELFES